MYFLEKVNNLKKIFLKIKNNKENESDNQLIMGRTCLV